MAVTQEDLDQILAQIQQVKTTIADQESYKKSLIQETPFATDDANKPFWIPNLALAYSADTIRRIYKSVEQKADELYELRVADAKAKRQDTKKHARQANENLKDFTDFITINLEAVKHLASEDALPKGNDMSKSLADEMRQASEYLASLHGESSDEGGENMERSSQEDSEQSEPDLDEADAVSSTSASIRRLGEDEKAAIADDDPADSQTQLKTEASSREEHTMSSPLDRQHRSSERHASLRPDPSGRPIQGKRLGGHLFAAEDSSSMFVKGDSPVGHAFSSTSNSPKRDDITDKKEKQRLENVYTTGLSDRGGTPRTQVDVDGRTYKEI